MLPYLLSLVVVVRGGIIPAIMTLGASLRQGSYCWNVQVETARKTSAWYGNAHDAGSAYVVTALGDGMHSASVSPTTEKWYSRQARGVKLKMGVVRFHNEAPTSKMVLALDDIPEKEWYRPNNNTRWEMIEELMSFVLIGFGAGLREEEILLVSF